MAKIQNHVENTIDNLRDSAGNAHEINAAYLDGKGAEEYVTTDDLPTQATSTKLGLVKSSTTGTAANRNYNVQVNSDGTMKVNVPWTDTNTSHNHSAGVGLVGSGSAGTSGTYTYKAKLRSETALTVDSTAATALGRVYPVAVDKSGYLSVKVPSAGFGDILKGITGKTKVEWNALNAGEYGSNSTYNGATIPPVMSESNGAFWNSAAGRPLDISFHFTKKEKITTLQVKCLPYGGANPTMTVYYAQNGDAELTLYKEIATISTIDRKIYEFNEEGISADYWVVRFTSSGWIDLRLCSPGGLFTTGLYTEEFHQQIMDRLSGYQPAGDYQPKGNYVTTDEAGTISGKKTFSSTPILSTLKNKKVLGTDTNGIIEAHTLGISDIANLKSSLDGKASESHTHAISDVTNLQSILNEKANSSHTHSISQITNLQKSLDAKLDKTTYEWNKEFAAGSNGAVSLGRYNIYDSQLTFDITSTTNQSISGKLVIATQNGTIHQAKVFGDASGALVSKLIIYQSAISNSRSWVEVFCNFNGWSKNKVHIYAVALNSATVQKQMTSVSISNGVPAAANVTSGDTKWTGTIVNDFNHSHGNYVTTNTAQTISGVKTFSDSIILPPKNAIMLGTGADGKIYDNTDFYNKKLDGIVINDMTETDTDGYYCFRKDYHSKLTQYKTLTGFFGHANVLHKGGRVSNNNTKFVGFGEADGYPWFGFTTYDRDYSDVADAQLVESYGIMVRKGVVAGHSSAYIIDGGASTDKETRLVTEDEMAGKANVGHTHAISEITNLQSTLNGKANASHTHTISQITNLQTTLDNKQNKIEDPCSFRGSNSNYVKLIRAGTNNYYVEIERGRVTYNGSTTQYPEIKVTFPREFNEPPTVIVSFAPTSNSTGTYEALKVINVTKTGFTVITRMSASISGGYFRVNWIAIYTV